MRSSPRGGLVVEPLRCEKPGEPAAALSRRRRRILRQLFGGEELGERAATRRRRRGLGGLRQLLAAEERSKEPGRSLWKASHQRSFAVRFTVAYCRNPTQYLVHSLRPESACPIRITPEIPSPCAQLSRASSKRAARANGGTLPRKYRLGLGWRPGRGPP